MAKLFPTPQSPDSSVGAGQPSFYVDPAPSMPVDSDNQNNSRDVDISEDALQGIPSAVPPWIPGTYDVNYAANDTGGFEVTISRTGDQVNSNGMSFLPRSDPNA